MWQAFWGCEQNLRRATNLPSKQANTVQLLGTKASLLDSLSLEYAVSSMNTVGIRV